MDTIDRYPIRDKIYESVDTIVYRGHDPTDRQPVVLKVLNRSYPSPGEIAGFRREFEITRGLESFGIVEAVDLVGYGNSLAMVMEDFGGRSLDIQLVSNHLNLTRCLDLALRLAEIVGELHRQHIVHKDINPSNIVWNSQTDQLKLIDFGLAVSSAAGIPFPGPGIPSSNPSHPIPIPSIPAPIPDIPAPTAPRQLEGTLAYISPEQTGRTNRTVDYRTDFYSLGITFYEIFCGELPFSTEDRMELVHAHIARKPVPPHERNRNLPTAVSEVVMKLTSKSAEERYQSAAGLRADLRNCLEQLKSLGSIEPFVVGEKDAGGTFHIPEKLYGRKEEIGTLMAAFDRVVAGETQAVLVSGASGVGKSALVNEIHNAVIERGGYFISGKFDQLRRNIPYSSLVQAFQELVRQLLTESSERFAFWKEKLLESLGAYGRIVIDVIPEVELIIGPQPPVPDLPPSESQNRFNLVFQRFVQTFTASQNPLVVFLDDLQWTDLPSLQLVERLATHPETGALLLVGAYRDNEVPSSHPLAIALENIQKHEASVENITLSPLNLKHIRQLTAETFKSTSQQVKPLAKLCLNKTFGNPFFLRQFLHSLDEENLVRFLEGDGTWFWDIKEIEKRNLSDNVADLMAVKVGRLPGKTREVLKLAACMGYQFSLEKLSLVYDKHLAETVSDLWEAVREGLILPMDQAFKFLHDSIQQAAYALIEDERKQEMHLKIGRLLLENTGEDQLEESLFDITYHLDLASELIEAANERRDLARLNLRAGKKARHSAAYQPALEYIEIGIDVLGANKWEKEYDLTLELCTEATEIAYLGSNFELMDRWAGEVRRFGRNPLDLVRIIEVEIMARIAENHPLEAIRIALPVLKRLGVILPEKPRKWQVLFTLLKMKWMMTGKKTDDLLTLPAMTDPSKLAAMHILSRFFTAAFMTASDWVLYCVYHLLRLSLKYGNASASPLAYVFYGLILSSMKDFKKSRQFGKLALSLQEQIDNQEFKPKTLHVFITFIKETNEHPKHLIQPYLENYQTALELGDQETAANSIMHWALIPFFGGQELAVMEENMEKADLKLRQLKDETCQYRLKPWRQAVHNLRGRSKSPHNINGEHFEEAKILQFHLDEDDTISVFAASTIKFILCYLFDRNAEAVRQAAVVQKYFDSRIESSFFGVFVYFFDSLVHLSSFNDHPKLKRIRILHRIKANQKKIKRLMDYSPGKYSHRWYLVEAEHCRVLGRDMQALEAYHLAIRSAKANDYLMEEAMGNELLAKFYLGKGQEKTGGFFMKEAVYLYRKWGAEAKVAQLEDKFGRLPPAFSGSVGIDGTSGTAISATPTDEPAEVLDLAAVMKASQAISGEIRLNELLGAIMGILIENAGAQRGCLLMEREEEGWSIAAEGSSETGGASVEKPVSLASSEEMDDAPIPFSVAQYVQRTGEMLLLEDAREEKRFAGDPYIVRNRTRSVLCLPVADQGNLGGILYLENNLGAGIFTSARVETLKMLAVQAAISIDNARHYERERSLVERMKETDRLKDEFLANTSHELRTPLSGMVGIGQWLLEDAEGALNPEQSGQLKMVVQSGRRLSDLINDILDFSRLKNRELTLHPQAVEIGGATDLVLRMCRPLADRKKLELVNSVPADLPPALADENRLQQILFNLVGNAVKFTSTGNVEVSAESTDGRIGIHIVDTGIGIAPEHREKIFDPFEQGEHGDRTGQGAGGLGLALSRKLVELHGGELSLDSEPGRGTRFSFTLPIVEETVRIVDKEDIPNVAVFDRAVDVVSAPDPSSPPRFGRPYILVVDDDPVVSQVLVNTLDRAEYRVA
ncbi:MAG: AAA family ATPase, partial [Proteobacteria bacterium]|nr:AAA family ATPase [Pseudomonadota bacterium]